MAPADPMENLLKARRKIKSQLQTMKSLINVHTTTPLTSAAAQVHVNALKKLEGDLDSNMNDIGLLCTDAEYLVHEAVFDDLLRKLAECQIMCQDIIASAPVITPAVTHSDVRLPRMELPKFDGELSQWLQFKDLFTSAVHTNTKISDAQKLTYLNSSLTGNAAKLLNSLPSVNANYSIAWKTLTERFQNDRELVFAILRKFVNQPNVSPDSATAIRSLIDISKESMRGLETMAQPIDQWDTILIFLMLQKLDTTSRQEWELTLTDTAVPQVKPFFDFLETRARALASTASCKPKAGRGNEREAGERKGQTHFGAAAAQTCKLCSQSHPLYKCPEFIQMNVKTRKEFVDKKKLCSNCFRDNHFAKKCQSKFTCKQCKRWHNTLLHEDSPANQPGSSSAPVAHHTIGRASGSDIVSAFPKTYTHAGNPNHIGQGMLATAMVKVLDSQNKYQTCRVFLDNGSTVSIITENCAKRLGLRRNKTKVDMTGLAEANVGVSRGTVAAQLFPHFSSDISITVSMLLLPKITGNLPVQTLPRSLWSHLENLQLADPEFHKPSGIDILIGSDIFWDILMHGRKMGSTGQLNGIESQLGWLVTGNLADSLQQSSSLHISGSLDTQLQRFWELENVPTKRIFTKEEAQCEQHFVNTTKRSQSGRYIVSFPFKADFQPHGASRESAVRRLLSLEKRLAGQPQFRQEYIDFMREYLSLGHMQRLSSEEFGARTEGINYIPHHFVLKESSTTTKFRVVFDASSKTGGGASLNEGLMVGPTIQDPLVSILTRFRTHLIAFTADIAKMYRQIQMDPKDINWQRIVWREKPTEEIQDFQLLTVTYGTASAPFHATRVLQQLALDEQNSLPFASKIAIQDFYVDDLMSGADSVENAMKIKQQLLELTKRGGMELRKWTSNNETFLSSLPLPLRETNLPFSLDKENLVKTLGLFWNAATDSFTFKVQLPPVTTNKVMTKRSLLSAMSKTFDPLGWLAPIIIRAKIMFQQLWKTKTDWDEALPESIQQEWNVYRQHLPSIEKISIPRCIKSGQTTQFTLHGFSDASEQAYAGVVYLKADTTSGVPIISNIASKTRVAPSKTISIPRLELCGALLLSNLMESVQNSLNLDISSIYAWTDSTVVLAWLDDEPSRWKTFVANRVAEVQNGIGMTWGHVNGGDNPADCASRGIDPDELVSHRLWWNGPEWLQGELYPTQVIDASVLHSQAVEMERKKPSVFITIPKPMDISLLQKYSTLTKLKRITAWCNRFVFNCRSKAANRKSGNLQAEELEDSLIQWIRIVQSMEFHQEVSCFVSNLPCSSTSKLFRLNPYMDSKQVLRVGGRLKNAPIPEDHKNPMVLPKHHNLTQLIIQDAHSRHHHSGPQLTLSTLQCKFWIIGAKDAIRHQLRKCVTCTRHRAKPMQQFMGDLPAGRVTPTRPFLRCGVDYGGPFSLRPSIGRSKVTMKGYLALFVCFSTRAIHCEVVSSLTTDAFLAALKRFVARRGLCQHIHSDCGTNFVGAARELKEVQELVQSDAHNNAVATHLANQGIQWHFNPPGTPHFGGLWEAGIKSVKYHLHRIVGTSRLTFEELVTVVTQIEACCNSRPLTPCSTDPSDLTALTPGHFLIGEPLLAVPEVDITTEKINRLSRWQLIQQMTQHFWTRWSKEFLARLQQRPKWLHHRTDIRIGDMVIIKHDNTPPLNWKLGRVIDTHPGDDGLIRVATVLTQEGPIKRPIVKLCLLPIDNAVDNSAQDQDQL